LRGAKKKKKKIRERRIWAAGGATLSNELAQRKIPCCGGRHQQIKPRFCAHINTLRALAAYAPAARLKQQAKPANGGAFCPIFENALARAISHVNTSSVPRSIMPPADGVRVFKLRTRAAARHWHTAAHLRHCPSASAAAPHIAGKAALNERKSFKRAVINAASACLQKAHHHGCVRASTHSRQEGGKCCAWRGKKNRPREPPAEKKKNDGARIVKRIA